ncbi:MAG: hypothetical protein J0H31_18525, partial [Alphaproteobacteria bacterium]|nr:hypothetical protein [Alphaproteobacteria bacterium]
MSKIGIFIQVQGETGLREAELAEAATLGELHDALAALGLTIDAETFIFIDEAEQHEHGERDKKLHGLKHGGRVHVTRCKRI